MNVITKLQRLCCKNHYEKDHTEEAIVQALYFCGRPQDGALEFSHSAYKRNERLDVTLPNGYGYVNVEGGDSVCIDLNTEIQHDLGLLLGTYMVDCVQ